MAKRIPTAKARAGLRGLVEAVRVDHERIKITRYGKTAAYLVPPRDGEALENCAQELADCGKRQKPRRGRKPTR
jgi:prevent-host-death family protein